MYEWPKFVYAHTPSPYNSEKPLHLGIVIEYDKASKTFDVTCRKESLEYLNNTPIECFSRRREFQGLSIDDAIGIGMALNRELEFAAEIPENKKNSIEKTEIKFDKPQKVCDLEIEL